MSNLETILIKQKTFYGVSIPYNDDLIRKAKELNGRYYLFRDRGL